MRSAEPQRTRSSRRPLPALRGDRDLLAIQELAELIVASSRSASQRQRLLGAAAVPVTMASLAALRVIDRTGPVALSVLAERLELDQSTVSRQVRPLEEAGLADRSADPEDRRAVRVRVTPGGRRLLRRVRDVALNDYDVALSDWAPADRAMLGTLVGRLRRDLLRIETDAEGWSVGKSG